jgi:transposase
MITDSQKARVRRLCNQGFGITACARKYKMDRKTVSSILNEQQPPAPREPRTYRTRVDPLEPFWPEIEGLLKKDSKLKPYIILEEMRRRHPDEFSLSWQRTLERRVDLWKVEHQVEQEVFFDQDHEPGDVLAVDFSNMNELGVMIEHQRFDHLIFHGVLTYSNWEYAEVCQSESFEALASGVQGCFHAMGGVTERLRTDSLSAAVNNLTTDHLFRGNYKRLLSHFQVEPHRINVKAPEENGDCESSHGHFKDYIDQRLRLRGDRNFESLTQYKSFLKECVEARNQPRSARFRDEQATLAVLPASNFPCYTQFECTVTRNSIVTVKQNRYSVPSCFIGRRVQLRVHADRVELWYAGKLQLSMPRMIGKELVFIDFRHVIDSLVRKPGAFARFRYREHMYPSIEFRKLLDHLVEQLGEPAGISVYLHVLLCAKQEGMAVAESISKKMIEMASTLTKKSALAMLKDIQSIAESSVVEDCVVEIPDLDAYDSLLEHKEVLDESERKPDDETNRDCDDATRPISVGFPFEDTAFANDEDQCDNTGRASSQGELESLGVSQRIDDSRMPITLGEPSLSKTEDIAVGTQQDLGTNQLEPPAVTDPPTHGVASQWRVLEDCQQHSDFRQTRFRKDLATQRIGGCHGEIGTHGMLCAVCEVGTASVGCQTRLETASDVIEVDEVFSLDHRRSGLCAAESGRDGSALHVDRRSLREGKYPPEFELAVLEVGEHLQGSDDHSSSYRSTGASQHDPGAQCAERTIGRGKADTRGPEPTALFVILDLFDWGNLIVAKGEN